MANTSPSTSGDEWAHVEIASCRSNDTAIAKAVMSGTLKEGEPYVAGYYQGTKQSPRLTSPSRPYILKLGH